MIQAINILKGSRHREFKLFDGMKRRHIKTLRVIPETFQLLINNSSLTFRKIGRRLITCLIRICF